MSSAIFPKEWWKLSPEDYQDAKSTMRALAAKDCDAGTKEVRNNLPLKYLRELRNEKP